MTDAFDSLIEHLDILDGKRRKLWHECRDASGVVVGCHPIAVSPRDDAAVAAWEQRCISLHQNQEPVTIPAKPKVHYTLGARGLRSGYRSDEPAVPRFEDLPESERKRILHRSD